MRHSISLGDCSRLYKELPLLARMMVKQARKNMQKIPIDEVGDDFDEQEDEHTEDDDGEDDNSTEEFDGATAFIMPSINVGSTSTASAAASSGATVDTFQGTLTSNSMGEASAISGASVLNRPLP